MNDRELSDHELPETNSPLLQVTCSFTEATEARQVVAARRSFKTRRQIRVKNTDLLSI